MTVLVVDDERRSRERLARLLRGVADIQVVGEAAGGTAALEAIASLQPHAVFLDVRMPGMTGFDVVAALPTDQRPWVVFVTAYDQHALEAFDVSAVDYLVKPVTKERLARAVARLREREAHHAPPEDAQKVASRPPLQRIIGKQRRSYYVLTLEAIEAFVADQALVFAVTGSGRFLVEVTLRTLEERLDAERFARVHKQTIVNLGHLHELTPVSTGGATARLRSGHVIEISRRYAPLLRRLLDW
jgi:DNA-binding LytR/AlgR family response regulator